MEQQNYNFTDIEVDVIKLSIETFLNYMGDEDKERYGKILSEVSERLELK